MNYSKWTEQPIAVADLSLDIINPRMPYGGKKLTQNDIIRDLVENEDVYGLAELIVKNGYLPDQRLIVVREDGRLVVVEGNRRLAACKLLIDPELAPTEWHNRFLNLSRQIDPASISSVKTLIAPKREDTIALIVSKHTDSSIKRWDPTMQANFYAQQIKKGISIENLSTQTGVSENDIKYSLLTAGVYALAKKAPVSAETKPTLNNPRLFSISTLMRLLDKRARREFLGIKQDNKGKVTVSLPKKTFNKRFGRVVSDIASGIKNSRNLNTDPQITEYFKEIDKGYLPTKKSAASSMSTQTATSSSKTPQKTKIPVGLIAPDFPCETSNDRIKEITLELKRLPVDNFPNATAVLLRVALELGAFQYINDLQEITSWKSDLAKKGFNRWDTFPSLTPMLERIAEKDLVDPSLKKVIQTILGKKDPLIDELNLYVHNGTYIPTPSDIRGHWKKLSALLKLFFAKRP